MTDSTNRGNEEGRGRLSGPQLQPEADAVLANVRKAMAAEERNRARQAARRTAALFRSAVLHPGQFSRWKVQRQELIDAGRELQRLAGRPPR